MTKQEIAQKHGFIQGMSIHSNTAKIEECLYVAMEEYAQQQVKLFAIPVVMESCKHAWHHNGAKGNQDTWKCCKCDIVHIGNLP